MGSADDGRSVDVDAFAMLLRRQARAGGGQHIDLVTLRQFHRDVARGYSPAPAQRWVLVVDKQDAHAAETLHQIRPRRP